MRRWNLQEPHPITASPSYVQHVLHIIVNMDKNANHFEFYVSPRMFNFQEWTRHYLIA